jgi:signal transduction histidine kinase
VRKDGSRFWAGVVIEPIRDEARRLVGFAKVTRDATERREVQRALEEMRVRLARSQRLEAVGRLVGGVAHDFGNLIQVVSSELRLLERHLPRDTQRPDAILRAIRETTARGEEVTRRMLAFSRLLPLRPETVDTAARLRGAADQAARSLRGGVRVEAAIPDGLAPVEVDPAQFELALLNLAENAADAMPGGGGVLRIEAENVAHLRDPETGLEGDYVAVRVIDTGTGIPADLLGRVVEPFFTTKPPGQGTGLGLSHAYGFAKQSGGALAIASEVGRGTTSTCRRGAPAPPPKALKRP